MTPYTPEQETIIKDAVACVTVLYAEPHSGDELGKNRYDEAKNRLVGVIAKAQTRGILTDTMEACGVARNIMTGKVMLFISRGGDNSAE